MNITGDFTGNSRAAFPYLLAAKPDQKIFSPDSVPKDFTLSDPDHLNAFKIEALYHHLLDRQKKGLSPFVVLNPGPLHGAFGKKAQKSGKAKGKQKILYVEVGSEDGEEDEEKVDGEKDDTPDEELEQEDVDKNEEEEEEGDDDEEIRSVVNYGPPNRRGNPSTPPLSQVAGPSRLPSAKHSPKKKNPKNRKAAKAEEMKDGKRSLVKEPAEPSGVSKVIKAWHAAKLTRPRLNELGNGNVSMCRSPLLRTPQIPNV